MSIKDTKNKPVNILSSKRDDMNLNALKNEKVVSCYAETQAELNRVKDEFNQVIDHIECGIGFIDRDFTVRKINRALADMVGIEPEEAAGKKCWEVFPGPLCHSSDCYLERMLKGEVRIRQEVIRKGKNGVAVPCIVAVAPLRMESDEITGIIQTIRDISEKKKDDDRIRESEERYRALIEMGDKIGEAVIMLQEDGVHVFASDQWVNLTGYRKDELLHMNFFDLISPEDRPSVIARHLKKLSGVSIPGLFELSIIRKDGVEIPIELTSGATHFLGQTVNVVYIRDISQRKMTEQLLKRSNELYLTTINLTGDIITRVDRDHRRILVNDAACEFYGRPREQLLGEQFVRVLYQDDIKPTLEAMDQMRRTGKPIKGLINRIYTSTGLRIVEWNCYPYFDDGNFDGWQATGRDITERRRLEEEVIETKSKVEALKESEKMKDELLCTVSHELRTPLAMIKGFISTLLQEDVAWSDEQTKNFLHDIYDNTERLNRLINDLLDMSCISADVLKLQRKAHPLNEIFDASRSVLGKIAEEHQLIMDVPSKLPDVFVDKERIVQVLSNLVDNATKFSKPGSDIKINVASTNEEVIISVADEGIGISPGTLSRVFERFYQARSVTNNYCKGTGLGLAICQGIIAAHGGRIWAESQEDKGSKFSFSLPLSGEQGQEIG